MKRLARPRAPWVVLALGIAALVTQRGTPTFAQVNTGPGDFVTEVPDGDSCMGIRATLSCPAGGGLSRTGVPPASGVL